MTFDLQYSVLACLTILLASTVHPNEDILISIQQNTVPEQIQENVLAVFKQMGRYHPSEPHWYLLIMGVKPF
jgi:hypothetical protein